MIIQDEVKQQWGQYLQRYACGEWRALVFRDMIFADSQRIGNERGCKLSFLDIGCGSGFDGDPTLQNSIAQIAGKFIGIEPDADIKLQDIFNSTYRCSFEDAPIEPNSIDIAFAVMVLEHIENPQVFFDKIHKILRKGGVFWGFTMDARHWFVTASILADKLRIKNWYLDMIHGRIGDNRYENYKVYYSCNSPTIINNMTKEFGSRIILNFNKVGQIDYYIPKILRAFGRILDRFMIYMSLPGSIIAVRLEK